MTRSRMASVALAAVLGAAGPAGAHDFWIEPSSFQPAPGSVLRVRWRVGEHFEGVALPRRESLIDRFEIDTPSQRAPIVGEDGVEPAGLVRIEEAGTHALIYQSRGGLVELPADRFESYLREEGLELISKQRAARGASSTIGRERFYRCAKSLVVAGNASQVPAARSGLTLEIVPRGDPSRLRAGDALPITVFFRGRPLEGALVRVVAREDPFRESAQRTNRRGDATLTLPGAGPYLVKVVWMQAAPPGSDVDWESWWASLVFDVVESR